jgi:DNA-binding XRE family transcriptional regulator
MQNVTLEGKKYVILPREEYDRLAKSARLPAFPEPNERGNYPAVEYARVSIARSLIQRREALGWTQADAARKAGIPVATLCRLETGKTTPSIATVDKLDRVLTSAEGGGAKKRSGTRGRRKAAPR